MPCVPNERVPVIRPLTTSGYPEPHCIQRSERSPSRASGLPRPVGPWLICATCISLGGAVPSPQYDLKRAQSVAVVRLQVVILLMGPWAFPLTRTPRCLPVYSRLVTNQAFSVPVMSGLRVTKSLCTRELGNWQIDFCSPRVREIWLLLVSWPRTGSHDPFSGVTQDPSGNSTDNASHPDIGC